MLHSNLTQQATHGTLDTFEFEYQYSALFEIIISSFFYYLGVGIKKLWSCPAKHRKGIPALSLTNPLINPHQITDAPFFFSLPHNHHRCRPLSEFFQSGKLQMNGKAFQES